MRQSVGDMVVEGATQDPLLHRLHIDAPCYRIPSYEFVPAAV